MKKSNTTSKVKLSTKEIQEELSAIAEELRTSTVSFTKARLGRLIERLGAETASKPKTKSTAKAKPRKKKAKS